PVVEGHSCHYLGECFFSDAGHSRAVYFYRWEYAVVDDAVGGDGSGMRVGGGAAGQAFQRAAVLGFRLRVHGDAVSVAIQGTDRTLYGSTVPAAAGGPVVR